MKIMEFNTNPYCTEREGEGEEKITLDYEKTLQDN